MAALTGASSLEPMIDAAVNTLEANGFETVVISAGRSTRDELIAWELLARSGCDGIIMHSDCLSNDQLARLLSTRKNVVLAQLINTQVGRLAASHLIKSGHRQLALVTGPLHYFCAQHTLEGFTKQLGCPSSKGVHMQSLEASLDEEGGANAMNILLAASKVPTAVFFQHDRMAIGALRVCQEFGIRVPNDISLLGCGNQAATAYTRPALCSIRQPLVRVGEHAAQRVMNMINGVLTQISQEAELDWASPSVVTRRSVRDRNDSSDEGDVTDNRISARERECLNWAAKGKTSWEISQILGVTESTIIYHLRNATRKLNAANRLHAVAKALKASIIDF
ncbi:MAG: substrate-binding domain-containing protein [Granulosicoccus sp.]|nr:substrate-binding domain-containing protein [Granulosicoccus sp.]